MSEREASARRARGGREAGASKASARGGHERGPVGVASAVVLDYGGRLHHLHSAVLAYRDLSPQGNAAEAAAAVFEALRWSEAQAARGGKCVLLPKLAESAAEIFWARSPTTPRSA